MIDLAEATRGLGDKEIRNFMNGMTSAVLGGNTMATATKRPTPITAKLEVVVSIDQDEWDEAIRNGVTKAELNKAIIRAITLADIPFLNPVEDIDSVALTQYDY